ncbi:MAG: DUF4397 domain-containing protein [Pseudomonadota bacterium]
MSYSTTASTPWWRHFATMALASVLVFGTAGCDIFDDDDDDDEEEVVDDGDDGGEDPVGTALARVFHAVADAPDVDALADGNVVFEDIAFKAGTAFAEVDAVTTEFSVNALTAGGEVTVIMPTAVELLADTEYTIAAIGSVATIAPIVIANPVAPVTAGNVRVQVVHASPDAPAVDVFVTAPDADLAAAGDPLTSFEFGEFTGQVEVPAGDYQIRVTLAGDIASVVFDSGTISLTAGLDLQIYAVNNTATGAAPITLAAIDASGALPDGIEVFDTATPASLRVVHASPDAPPVDVVVNDDFDNPAVSELAFPAFTDFLDVALEAGDPSIGINVKVTPAGNTMAVNGDGMGDDVDLERGVEYTVLATGLLADFSLLVLEDDDRPIATDARVRIVHGSPAAGEVDIYVAAPQTDIATIDPAFAAVPFRADTGYVPLAPGDYEVTVTPTGTTDAAIGPIVITVEAGGTYTAVARDAQGGGAPLGLILFDDFAD